MSITNSIDWIKNNYLNQFSIKHVLQHLSCFILFDSSTVGPFRPYFPKITSSVSWLLIGGELLRKIFGKSSESGSENGSF